MVEFQLYNKGKEVSHRSNMTWAESFELLEVKKKLEVDQIDIQLYTDDFKGSEMPVDDITVKTIVEAQRWINYVHGKIIKREYPDLDYGEEKS